MVKKTNANSAFKASNLLVALDTLVTERESFEREEYARSNAKLYEILTKIYSAYKIAKGSDLLLTETVRQMKQVLQQSGDRIQTNTLAINLFVRYVFRTSRQRAHNYSRTLQAAFAKDIAPEALPQFIADGGGVEECKKDFVKGPKALERELKILNAIGLVEEQLVSGDACLAEFTVGEEWVAGSYKEELTLLIGKSTKRGNVRVVSVVPAFSKGAANWSKKQLALFLADQQIREKEASKNKRKEVAMKVVTSKAKNNNSATETVGELLAA